MCIRDSHYISPQLKLYDFVFIFPNTKKETEERVKSIAEVEMDKAYDKARHDSGYKEHLMKYMKLHILVQAFNKHEKAYGDYPPLFEKVLVKIKRETGLELNGPPSHESLRALDKDLKHFFDI